MLITDSRCLGIVTAVLRYQESVRMGTVKAEPKTKTKGDPQARVLFHAFIESSGTTRV